VRTRGSTGEKQLSNDEGKENESRYDGDLG
jgi:hypothetical protein